MAGWTGSSRLATQRSIAQGYAIDQLVLAEMAQRYIPGLPGGGPGLGRDQGCGLGPPDRVPVGAGDSGTIYKLGSVTKQYTANGVMLLVPESELVFPSVSIHR